MYSMTLSKLQHSGNRCPFAKIFTGKAYEGRKPRKVIPVHRIKSFYPLRENIWEYVNDYEDRNLDIEERKSKKSNKQTLIKPYKSRSVTLLIFFLLTLGFTSQYLKTGIFSKNQITKILMKITNISYVGIDSTPVNEECCRRMKHLALALNRAEQALSTLRHRKSILALRSFNPEFVQENNETGHVEGAVATTGRNTTEWGGNIALWGVLPLWRAAPPPDTVLKLQSPTPSDCWPFRGTFGEILIDLPKKLKLAKISIEHIRPDTARSAPKNFKIFGILSNGTWIKAADGIYKYNKPATQYFNLEKRNTPFQQIVLRVLSNQGNMKYTCIYRLRFYEYYYDYLKIK